MLILLFNCDENFYLILGVDQYAISEYSVTLFTEIILSFLTEWRQNETVAISLPVVKDLCNLAISQSCVNNSTLPWNIINSSLRLREILIGFSKIYSWLSELERSGEIVLGKDGSSWRRNQTVSGGEHIQNCPQNSLSVQWYDWWDFNLHSEKNETIFRCESISERAEFPFRPSRSLPHCRWIFQPRIGVFNPTSSSYLSSNIPETEWLYPQYSSRSTRVSSFISTARERRTTSNIPNGSSFISFLLLLVNFSCLSFLNYECHPFFFFLMSYAESR